MSGPADPDGRRAMTVAGRRGLLAAALGLSLPGARAADAGQAARAMIAMSPTQEPRTMSADTPTPNKVPRPPQSTLDLRDHVDELRLRLGVGFSGNADQDFARLLAVQHKYLAELARIQLRHGSDAELRAVAQRIVDAAPAEAAALQEWQARHPR